MIRSVMVFIIWAMAFSGFAQATPQYHDYSLHTHWNNTFHTQDDDLTSVAVFHGLGRDYLATTGSITGLSFYRSGATGLDLTGNLPLPGWEQGVAFIGQVGYVIVQPASLIKVFCSSPSTPVSVWNAPLPFDPFDVEAYGSYLVIACGSDGLVIFDTQESFGLPHGVVGEWEGIAHEVKLSGTTALVRTDTGVVTIDLTDPTLPVTLDSQSLPGAHSLLVDGTTAYVGSASLVAELDLAHATYIDLVRTMSWAPSIFYYENAAMALADGGLYLASSGDLQFMDLESGQLTWTGDCLAQGEMIIHDDILAIANGWRGLQTYRLKSRDYSPASEVFQLNGDPAQFHLKIVGDLMFGFSLNKTRCYDLGQIPPVEIWTHEIDAPGEYPQLLTVDQNHVYVGTNVGNVLVLEYSSDGCTEVASFFSGGTEIIDMDLLDGYLAVFVDPIPDGFQQGEVLTYDLAKLSDPQPADSYLINAYSDMLVEGSTIVLSDGANSNNGLRLVDASDPADLTLISIFPTESATDVTSGRGHLYLVSSNDMKAIDISDPYSPQHGPSLSIPPHAWFLLVHGEVGYMTQTDVIYDLSDPLVPVPVGALSNSRLHNEASKVVGDGYLLVGFGDDVSLMPAHSKAMVPVNELRPVAANITLHAVPNPFNPKVNLEFSLQAAGFADVDIYDVRGRLVARLGGKFEQGLQTVVWQGDDINGRAIPSGVYLARVRTAAGQATRKIVLAR